MKPTSVIRDYPNVISNVLHLLCQNIFPLYIIYTYQVQGVVVVVFTEIVVAVEALEASLRGRVRFLVVAQVPLRKITAGTGIRGGRVGRSRRAPSINEAAAPLLSLC